MFNVLAQLTAVRRVILPEERLGLPPPPHTYKHVNTMQLTQHEQHAGSRVFRVVPGDEHSTPNGKYHQATHCIGNEAQTTLASKVSEYCQKHDCQKHAMEYRGFKLS